MTTKTTDVLTNTIDTIDLTSLLIGDANASSINIGSSTAGRTPTIVINTLSTLNTNASPAISIGASSSTKTIKIGNNSNSVHCSSIDLQGSAINNITATTGAISVGDNQTTGLLNLGTGASRTASINIGTGAGTKLVDIGNNTDSVLVSSLNIQGLTINPSLPLTESMSIGNTQFAGTLNLGTGARSGAINVGTGSGFPKNINIGVADSSTTITGNLTLSAGSFALTSNNVLCDSGGNIYTNGTTTSNGTIYTNGNVTCAGTLGTNNTGSNAFYCNGTMTSPATYNSTAGTGVGRAVYIRTSNNAFYCISSSQKTKQDIDVHPLGDSSVIYKLVPHTYYYKMDEEKVDLDEGFMAEEVNALDDKLAGIDKETGEGIAVNYNVITTYIVEEMKKMKKTIEDLTNEIEKLKNITV